MKESREYVGREMMFGRLDNLPNWDCMGLMHQWDMPAPDMAHSERHE